MNEANLFLILLIVGIVGHLAMRKSYDFGQFLRKMIAGQSGEGAAGAGAGGGAGAGAGGEPPAFTEAQQAHINAIVAKERKATESRFGDYDDLKKFKTENEKAIEAQKQKDLENNKQYDEAKKGYETKISDLSGKLTAKDQEIQNIKIDHVLTTEISKQNGFTEESLAMIRGRATVDANGNIVIKDKDGNGVDVNLSVEQGIKKLFTERPHLVRAAGKAGAGSGAGGGTGSAGAGAGGGGEETLESLNAQLQEAMKGTDLKLRSDLKNKIRALQTKRGVSL